jgi:hypothetical protein
MTSNNKSKGHHIRRCLLPLALAVTASSVQAGPTITYGDEGFLNISYALQFWAQGRSFTSETDSGSSTDFFLRRNRLTFSGQYNDYVGFYAQLEAGNDSKMGLDNRSVYYRDAYITFDFKDSMRFIVGRFKNTFTRENLEACLEPLTLDRAEVLAYTPFGGSRDTGVAMWGNLSDGHLQYRLEVADGREGDVVVKDSPRWTARVHWSPWDPETDYGYRGTYLGTRKVLTIGAAYDYQADVAYADYTNRLDSSDYSAWTADIFMEYPSSTGTYTASAAYMNYSTDEAINADPDPLLPVTSDLEGYYVKLGYMIPGKIGMGRLQLFGRYEDLDYGISNGYFDNTWLSAGANYYIYGQQLKVTFEYATIDYNLQHPTNQALRDYDQATLALQLIF